MAAPAGSWRTSRKADHDHRSPNVAAPPRRVLHEAILEAALAELAEVGYATLTMERVAHGPKASKASVYSRWPSRIELVMDVFYHLMPDPAAPAGHRHPAR